MTKNEFTPSILYIGTIFFETFFLGAGKEIVFCVRVGRSGELFSRGVAKWRKEICSRSEAERVKYFSEGLEAGIKKVSPCRPLVRTSSGQTSKKMKLRKFQKFWK
jgi:hypothetical protein